MTHANKTLFTVYYAVSHPSINRVRAWPGQHDAVLMKSLVSTWRDVLHVLDGGTVFNLPQESASIVCLTNTST